MVSFAAVSGANLKKVLEECHPGRLPKGQREGGWSQVSMAQAEPPWSGGGCAAVLPHPVLPRPGQLGYSAGRSTAWAGASAGGLSGPAHAPPPLLPNWTRWPGCGHQRKVGRKEREGAPGEREAGGQLGTLSALSCSNGEGGWGSSAR